MTAEEFNERYDIGTSVNYHSVIGQPEHVKTRTRSEAWHLPNNEPVVQVEGKSGCVALAAISIDPVVEEYVRLGMISITHRANCACKDCLAFLAAGDRAHELDLHA